MRLENDYGQRCRKDFLIGGGTVCKFVVQDI